MLENDDLEGLSSFNELDEGLTLDRIGSRDFLTDTEYNYLSEILPFNNSELLVNRIDELDGSDVPKGIDSNAQVSEMIESVKDTIDPIYLEAPDDITQIKESVEAMNCIEGLDYESWCEMSVSERANVMQNLENVISEIAHRPACQLNVSRMDGNTCGSYDLNSKQLYINYDWLKQDSFEAYRENIDTVIHEGRHAYQDYNLTVRMVHPREGEVNNWRINEYNLGYLDAQTYGMELYRTQPQEADAFAFAHDVISRYLRA